VSEGVNGATEVADTEQEEVRMLPGQGDRIENLVGRVPHGGPSPTGARQSAGITVTPMLESFLPADCNLRA